MPKYWVVFEEDRKRRHDKHLRKQDVELSEEWSKATRFTLKFDRDQNYRTEETFRSFCENCISRDKGTKKMIYVESLRLYPGYDTLYFDKIKSNGLDNYKLTILPKKMRYIINSHAREIRDYEIDELPYNWHRFKYVTYP